MSYLKFDKTKLINLEYSLSRESLRSNRAGSFGSTTIVNCNTRKYHGLLICPLDDLDGGNHILLSTLDETIIQHGSEFHLAVHKYPGVYHSGHKYIRDFHTDPIPTVLYRVGGVILKRETLLAEKEELILVRYTLEEAHSPTTMRLHPFLAFRNVHSLSKANLDVNTDVEQAQNGIASKLYRGYPSLFMQLSKKNDFVNAPNWFYNIEYTKEKERGYDHHEDLYVPGFFEFQLKKGEQIIFAAGLKELPTSGLKKKFEAETKKRTPRTSYENCLDNAAQQFIVSKDGKTEIIAGFPWFGKWGRDTFISLPGLTLARGDVKTCKEVLDTMVSDFRGSLFSKTGSKRLSDVDSVDAPLWFFWAVQKYAEHSSPDKIWKDYGVKIKRILSAYKEGREHNIKMHDNGLIYAGENGLALTWMDAVVEGKPVTPRTGYDVEINALWYNALLFSLEIAGKVNDTKFIEEIGNLPELVKKSFLETFSDPSKKYLADYVQGNFKDWAVRPNQLIAAALPYSPIDDNFKNSILEIIEKELLTVRGIRSLSPQHPDYKGTCSGNVTEKDLAYHQGTAWPWLLSFYAETYLQLHQKSGVNKIRKIYHAFEEEMDKHGIGTISEVYDGNPPHEARGAISQAWSVAALLYINNLLKKYE